MSQKKLLFIKLLRKLYYEDKITIELLELLLIAEKESLN
jgi:hypothetical protein